MEPTSPDAHTTLLLAVTRLGSVDVAFDASPIEQVLDADAGAIAEPRFAGAVDLEQLFGAPSHEETRRAVSVRVGDDTRLFVLGPALEFRRLARDALRGVPPFLDPLRKTAALSGFVVDGDVLSCILDWRELARLGALPPA